MSEPLEPVRIDRRTAIKWFLTAAGALSASGLPSLGAARPSGGGYGTDPELNRTYAPGDVWPLTFSSDQRRTAAALCEAIIPADAEFPSAASLGVHDFIDEWISAPYAPQREDRPKILDGLADLDSESVRRFGSAFAALKPAEMQTLCSLLCDAPSAPPEFASLASFFARFRDLTAGGYYTTPAGMKDIGYVGNVPLASFDPPPPEVLRKLGLD